MSKPSTKERAIAVLRDALDGRSLVWLGIRGEDARSLQEMPELRASFAVTAPMGAPTGRLAADVSLEDLTGVRVDLDAPGLDLRSRVGYDEFRRRLLDVVRGPSVLLPYRPTDLSSGLAYSERRTVTLAGPSGQLQAAFEHKPWVETALAARGVEVLPWDYVADEDRHVAHALVADGPIVLRPSRSSGGEGLGLAAGAADVDLLWPSEQESFVAISRYLSGAVPLNFSGVVFPDGAVRLHPPSVQLIGVEGCTSRRFGYCGNDFAAVKELPQEALGQVDRMGVAVGRWLHQHFYRGVFGVDALLHGGKVWFTEINPRFQGSSAVSADIAGELGVSDLFVDHLLATLGGAPVGEGLTTSDWARLQPEISHVVVHNTGQASMAMHEKPRHGGAVLSQIPRSGVVVEPGGTLGRIVQRRAVTRGGYDVDEPTMAIVSAVQRASSAPLPIPGPPSAPRARSRSG